MSAGPYGVTETGAVYQAVHALAELSRTCAIDVTVHHGHIDITTTGGPGVLRAWTLALAPARVVKGSGLYSSACGLGVEELLKTPEVTVHVRPAVGA